ncbi:hypothetical protein BU14_0014s0036 [Porphyra umbilicalis]|uniref:Secreted protein n=1 Tax=Porphyra umbilicalis TaxID=2786 RepID=A0A1X6PKP7_PORUM|nr:hypothetical protein BU14_0014s0036 [Porphyra umbilicalis]|eukprot:OSX81484.1 hypothetical protein BU14_0014s0036 [Porphyra umbilicalis]
MARSWPTPVAGLTGRLAVCFALLPSTCSCRRQRRRRAVVVGDMPPSRPSPRCRLSHAKRDSFRCLVSSSVVLLFEYFVVAWSTCRQLRSLRRRISAIASSAADHESASMILSAAAGSWPGGNVQREGLTALFMTNKGGADATA